MYLLRENESLMENIFLTDNSCRYSIFKNKKFILRRLFYILIIPVLICCSIRAIIFLNAVP